MATTLATTPEEQDRVLREACGLVDRSALGKLALTGTEAKSFLTGQVTNDIEALEPGHGQYAALLTPKGKMVADLRVLDTGDELLLLCERAGLQALFDTIRRFSLGHDVQLHKRTVQQGLLSLVGPRSAVVAGVDETAAGEEHANVRASIGGVDCLVVRTDLGVDVVCGADDVDRVRAALVVAGAVEVSEEAAEILRIESGRPRHGVELDETVIPQEAGLNDRAVSFTKGCYVGQETVARLHWRGKPNRHLRGLALSAPVEVGTELVRGEKVVGRIASAVDSPVHGLIALAFVRREAGVEDQLAMKETEATATVVELPFR
ncbi:MAG: folate-binding protein [Actinomycetota bacterium]|jgi:folate-binding protein YgfZ|nr:folate-binding protein [Actinomycetota bacterium]MDQ3371600.1 folate-binding protein [Actinomycetota bacterium]MDQ3408606.1 folate-binding protein [Actinomycetota bacterium]